jgi:hypothetical protein
MVATAAPAVKTVRPAGAGRSNFQRRGWIALIPAAPSLDPLDRWDKQPTLVRFVGANRYLYSTSDKVEKSSDNQLDLDRLSGHSLPVVEYA